MTIGTPSISVLDRDVCGICNAPEPPILNLTFWHKSSGEQAQSRICWKCFSSFVQTERELVRGFNVQWANPQP